MNSDILDRRLPYSLEAEQAVVGSCLLSPDAIDDVSLILEGRDFFDEANRLLWEHMHAMHQDGRAIDTALLCDRLKKANVWETVGGTAYLYRVGQSVPNAANARYYAQIVADHGKRRALISASTDTLCDSYEERSDVDDLVTAAEERIFAIRERRSTSETLEIRQVVDKCLDELDKRLSGEQSTTIVPTGFSALDATLAGGFRPQQLIVVAARPGMGKSAFATDVCRHVCSSERLALFISLEMSARELGDRVLIAESGVDGHRMRNATLSADDRRRVVEACGTVSQWSLHIQDDPGMRAAAIASVSRRLARRAKKPLSLLVVDYLQQMDSDDGEKRDGRERAVAANSRALKRLSKELDCPVLCVAQLNRKVEDRAGNVPKLSDLRESGAIEQDADVVLFVHREEYFLTGEAAEQAAGKAEIIVAKQRNGPTGTIDLRWDKRSMRFQNVAPDRLQEFDDYNRDEERRFF